jgi:phospholipid-binding lipoprotein MlaA
VSDERASKARCYNSIFPISFRRLHMMRFARVAALILCVSLVGCATTQPASKPDPRDPWERMNRATYRFNDTFDRAIARPVARGYRRVTPQFVQTGVSNFMDNIGYPIVIVNDVLQGKFRPALSDTGRFVLNTTLGLGGLLDPATAAGLDQNDEDFGQTLGKWGVPPGPYLVLPFIGPSNPRDGIGLVADQFADPRHYIERDVIRYSIQGVRLIDRRARLLDIDQTLREAFDPYAFVRNAYLQRRQYLVTDGEVPEEDLEEEFEDPEAEEPK